MNEHLQPQGTPEDALRRLRTAVVPNEEMKQRIKMKMHARLRSPELLRDLARTIHPESQTIWARVLERVEPVQVAPLFERLKTFLQPDAETQQILFSRVQMQLTPVYVPVVHRSIKWTAALALVLITVRLSPLLFIAPHSAAQSPLMLLPTRGQVSVLMGGLWQPVTKELPFTRSVLIRTDDGEATLVLHDDGVIRLGPNTTVALHDTADRPDPALHDPTVTLHSGNIWMQGLVPAHIPGVTLATPQGRIEVHEGSLSVVAGDTVEVRVWDRKINLTHEGKELTVLAGDRAELATDTDVAVKKIASKHYDEPWVAENLRRDAVHRREIAQLQHERRASLAGILPSSRLYSMKRMAETVDVLMTFGEEAKAQKKLANANTRLNEAAALLAEGDAKASEPLAEYRETLLQLATGSGDGSLVQFMLKQELAEATADIAAALPNDQSYALKKAVLETSAAVPGSMVDISDVQGVLLVDTLSSLMRSVEEGDGVSAKETFTALAPYLDSLDQEDSPLSEEMQAEAKASLGTFAVALKAFEDDVGGIDQEFLSQVETYLPAVPTLAALTLSDAQIDGLVSSIYNRIFIYKQPRSRWNQLVAEFRALDGHPDQGKILRRLYRELPENGLARYVKTEFERVKEANGQPTTPQEETSL